MNKRLLIILIVLLSRFFVSYPVRLLREFLQKYGIYYPGEVITK